jgi:SAM-dependent methyltransferase
VSSIDLNAGLFDRAIAIALLHHLNGPGAAALTQLVRRHVRQGGSFVTIDPDGGNDVLWLARRIIAQDRGRDVRTAEGYREILSACGPVEIERRTDLLRIPYAHVVARVTVSHELGRQEISLTESSTTAPIRLSDT